MEKEKPETSIPPQKCQTCEFHSDLVDRLLLRETDFTWLLRILKWVVYVLTAVVLSNIGTCSTFIYKTGEMSKALDGIRQLQEDCDSLKKETSYIRRFLHTHGPSIQRDDK